MASIRVHNALGPKVRRMRVRLGSQIGVALNDIGDNFVQEMDRTLSGRILHFRSGRLWASWRDFSVIRSSDSWRLHLGSDVPYARIHEFGGWTGRNHATHIPARQYVSRTVLKVLPFIRRKLQATLYSVGISGGK